MKKRIIIVGGGIHGLSCAMELSDSDYEIMLIEKKSELFLGTSGSTHNRAHMGYHYPRSAETAKECQEGLELFKIQFKDVLISPGGNYYAISKSNSQTSSAQFVKFCNEFQLPYESKWPDEKILKREPLCSSFLVPELIFDTQVMIDYFIKSAKENRIVFKKNTELLEGEKTSDDQFKIKVKENGVEKEYFGDILVNATYAYSNNILKAFGLERYMKRYKLQIVEIAVVSSNQRIPGLTIMDGPFISIMPYGKIKDLYLVYDVENSVKYQKEGYIIDDSIEIESNWAKMKEKGKRYFTFMDKLEYVDSLRACRPIPLQDNNRDRSTKIRTYDDFTNFYTILEGKFISAPLMAKKLKEMILLNINNVQRIRKYPI